MNVPELPETRSSLRSPAMPIGKDKKLMNSIMIDMPSEDTQVIAAEQDAIEDDIDAVQRQLPRLLSFDNEEQLQLLHLATQTIFDWVGGVSCDDLSAERLLKFLCDVFVYSRAWNANVSVEQFTQVLQEEYEFAHRCRRTLTKYTVHLLRGRNLLAKDMGGTSDPYCQIGLLPLSVDNVDDYSAEKFKRSTVIPKTLNPEWENEIFEFIVKDPQNTKFLIDFWDSDDEEWTNKLSNCGQGANDDFLGRLSIPLASLTSTNMRRWWTLKKRSKKSNVAGDIELIIKSEAVRTDGEQNMSVAELESHYRNLDAVFVLHEDGMLSVQSEAILTQFRMQNSLMNNISIPLRFINQIRRLIVKPLDTTFIAKTVAMLQQFDFKSLSKDIRTLLVQTFEATIKRFEYTLQKFQSFYPLEEKAGQNRLDGMCDILTCILSLPLYQESQSEAPLDLPQFITANLRENAQLTYNRGKRQGNRNSSQGVGCLAHLVVIITRDLERTKKYPNAKLKSLVIDLFDIRLREYMGRLEADLKKVMESPAVGRDCSPSIFELYFSLQTFYRNYLSKMPKEERDANGLSQFFEPFTPHVLDWMQASKVKTEMVIKRAIQVDKDTKPIEGQMFSSSVVDVFSGLFQTMAFLHRLDWPDIMIRSVFTTMFVQMICDGVTTYAENMRYEFQRKSQFCLSNSEGSSDGPTAAPVSFVTREQCIHLNNLEVTHQQMNTLYETLDLPTIVQQLHSVHGSTFEPPFNTLFNEQYEFVKESLEHCLDHLADQMAPVIMEYLTEMIGLVDQNAKPSNFKIDRQEDGGGLSYALSRVMGTHTNTKDTASGANNEYATSEEVERSMAPLIRYLDGNLEVLSQYLYQEVFQSILTHIWIRIVNSFNTILTPALDQMVLPVTRLQASSISTALALLRNYLHAGGDGIKLSKLDSATFLKLKANLGMVFVPTDLLIAKFYDLEAEMQSRIHKVSQGDQAISDTANESEPINIGEMEGEFIYDSNEDTLTIFLVEAENLPALDDNGYSDPYAIITLLTKGCHPMTRKSRVCYKTLHPVFKQSFTFNLHGRSLAETTCQILFYDYDFIGGDDYMGEVLINMSEPLAKPNKPYRNRWYLKHHSVANAALMAKYGSMDVSLTMYSNKGKLDITVNNCRDLPAMDLNGFSDPYILLRLIPSLPGDSKCLKSKIHYSTLNPDFNESFSLLIKDRPDNMILQMRIFDSDLLAKDDYIGEIILRLGSLTPNQPIRATYNVLRTSADSDSKFVLCILNGRTGDAAAETFCEERMKMFIES